MILPQASALVFLLLAGSADAVVQVRYSSPAVCAVHTSTLTLLCSFTPVKPLFRVVWCVNDLVYDGTGTTLPVYDSAVSSNSLRYHYLGDLERNCTLQINNIQKQDSAIFRFWMGPTGRGRHYTGVMGVRVTVVDGDPMRVESSAPSCVSKGAAVKLSCVSNCSFHGLEVRWRRDGRALPESSPTLWLTAAQSANYTCGLAARSTTMSPPFRLNVEQHQPDRHFAVTLGNSLRLLMVVLGVVPIIFILVKWRKCRPASRHNGKHAGHDQKGCEPVYMNATSCAEERRPRQTGSRPERKASP